MQTTTPGHHHQARAQSAEAELIALASGKGQTLTARSLRLIGETLELRGITLGQFVDEIRPHFANGIRNPSGFMIDFARKFHEKSQPAVAPPTTQIAQPSCPTCRGGSYIRSGSGIEPCPSCATPEIREEWAAKETARLRRRGGQS